jgi:prevent-host-death family protein
MNRTYSLYEAKAKLSEIIRAVRERGDTATITYHGEAVAEIRPMKPLADQTLMDRIAELEARGILQPATNPNATWSNGVASVPGALERFLADRD